MNMLDNTQTENMADLAALDAALSSFEAGEEYAEYSADDLTDFEALEDAIIDESAAALDAMIEGNEIEELAIEPVAMNVQASPDELSKLTQAIEQEKIYESQKPTMPLAELKAVATTVLGKKKKNGKARAGRVARSLEAVPAEFFVLTGNPSDLSETELQENKKAVMALKPLQVKIAEKFENLFTAISAGQTPSRYTQMAYAYLYDHKQATTTDLVVMFMKAGLGEGTARSQTGQMMTLLSVVKVADRVGQTLTLRTDSKIAERLNSLTVAPVASVAVTAIAA